MSGSLAAIALATVIHPGPGEPPTELRTGNTAALKVGARDKPSAEQRRHVQPRLRKLPPHRLGRRPLTRTA